MSKHTPGPWVPYRNKSYWQIDSERDGQIGDACASQFDAFGVETKETQEVAEANACLIAAAPDLLEALSQIIEQDDYASHRPAAYAKAVMAIRKARGET